MDYRKHLKKGSCLFNAMIWMTLIIVHLFYFFYSDSYLYFNLKSTWCSIFLLSVEAILCAVNWYRYLAYDKKRQEENHDE